MSATSNSQRGPATDAPADAFPLRGTIIGSVLLVVFDGVVTGQGGFALFLALWTIFIRIPLLMAAWKKRTLLIFRAKKVAIYLVTIVTVFGWVAFNRELSYRRAHEIVNAVDAYAVRYGHYPEKLEQLVPEFLRAIPLARLTLMLNQFEYRLMPGDTHWLSWTVVPPFGRQHYIFEEKRWNYLD